MIPIAKTLKIYLTLRISGILTLINFNYPGPLNLNKAQTLHNLHRLNFPRKHHNQVLEVILKNQQKVAKAI